MKRFDESVIEILRFCGSMVLFCQMMLLFCVFLQKMSVLEDFKWFS